MNEAVKKRLQKQLENPNLTKESREKLVWTLRLMSAEEN